MPKVREAMLLVERDGWGIACMRGTTRCKNIRGSQA